MQDAAVAAADLLISPIPPEVLSAREFVRGTVDMLNRLKPMAFMEAPTRTVEQEVLDLLDGSASR